MRKRRPSRFVSRQAREEAAREFVKRRNEVFLLNPDGTPQEVKMKGERAPRRAAAAPTPPPDLPQPGSVLGLEDSRAILARLASGDIKQVRRR